MPITCDSDSDTFVDIVVVILHKIESSCIIEGVYYRVRPFVSVTSVTPNNVCRERLDDSVEEEIYLPYRVELL